MSHAALALLLVGCGASPPPRAEAPVPERPAEPARPLVMWSVESPDGRVSHVLGTLHIGVRFGDVIPARHANALDRARLLIVEMDLANTHSPAIAPYTVLPPGSDLRALLPRELWPRLVEAFAPAIPEAALRRLQPWAVMSMLMSREASELEAEREGEPSDGPPSSIDFDVMVRAQGHGIAIQGLETIEEQAALLGSLPTADVVEYIASALDGERSDGPTLRAITDAYLAADLEALEAIVFDPEEIARSPGVFEALLYARNERWLPVLEPELAQGNVFVAVGLGHLIGDRGVLRLLEQRGYRVVRLSGP